MPRLTLQEQQEIIRYLEADRPLPDKYRFLLFEDKRQVELVWNGKTSEVSNVVLPFQIIEQVDEPRSEKNTNMQLELLDFDPQGRQIRGWTNKLIWGDNKLILSSLKNGPLREEIEAQGGLKLIYIDPPFDVGADFTMPIQIGDDTFTKQPNILEEIAYRDTWGQGTDSFLAMIYERLILMRDLLANDGSIYVHCDWRVSSCVRVLMDEIFGEDCFRNEIIWRKGSFFGPSTRLQQFPKNHDTIFFYTKSNDQRVFHLPHESYSDSTLVQYRYEDQRGRYRLQELRDYSEGSIQSFRNEGRIEETGSGPKLKQYLDDKDGKVVETVWTDINRLSHLLYPTEKPEALLERIIQASSNAGDLVADFFCGSGTAAAVAEKLGRRWIASDLGKFAIHTTRKRMIGVQRQLKAEGHGYRAFEILNLGKYERQHYVGVNPNLREAEQQRQLAQKEADFLALILNAYRAEKTEGFRTFHGKKAGRLVSVGPVNLPVTRLFVEEVIQECREKHVTRVDILGFEFEMGLFPNVLAEARDQGIDIAARYIPADVFDKRAVEGNQVVFHDVAYIEVTPRHKGNRVAIELSDFSVSYSQDSIAGAETSLKNKGSKIVVDQGQIVKVSKDALGITSREVLTPSWVDWIDYWAVDFNFESKREIIRIQNPATNEWEDAWTGDYVFENEWQSFRTKKERSLELTSVYQQCPPGRRKIAVKVVDIFGNDTMTIVEVSVGGKS